MTLSSATSGAEASNQNIGSSKNPPVSYTLKLVSAPVLTPADGTAKPLSRDAVDPFLRASHEDDDGYDPFSDRPEEHPLFEENPWG